MPEELIRITLESAKKDLGKGTLSLRHATWEEMGGINETGQIPS